ncbi:hypothetical protein ACW9UR_12710 [Halovulum sp. GXIMD14794]
MENPRNDANDWLVVQYIEHFGTTPDFSTAGGMAAGFAIFEAIKNIGGVDDPRRFSARRKAWSG